MSLAKTGAALSGVARHAGVILAAGVFAGLAAPAAAAAFRPALTPAVWALLALSAVRVDWAGAAREVRRPITLAAVVALLVVASPVVMAVVTRAMALPDGLAGALVLMAASSPIMSSPALALLLGLDAALSMVVMLAATLVVPLVVPLAAVGLLDMALDGGAGALMARLGLFVASALVCGIALRRLAGPARLARGSGAIDGGVVVLLVVFAVAIMDGVAARLIADPARVGGFVAAAFAANLGLQAAATLVCLGLGRRRALSVGLSSGNRNMALLMAVLPATSDGDIFLFFALAQLPIYILPAALSPLYRRLLGPQRRR